jgi:hypothetical protein
MDLHRLVAVSFVCSTLLYAEDFSLTQNGFGPITVHTAITFEGKGERFVATAINDSGQAVPYVKLCVAAETNGCLFELWNTEVWLPGKSLDWNMLTARHVANLSHEVKIEALNLPPKSQATPAVPVEPSRPATEARVAQPPAALPPAPEMTNETILKLTKAGLGDEVILGMLNNQQGRYALDADSIIALKQAGVSEKVIASLIESIHQLWLHKSY